MQILNFKLENMNIFLLPFKLEIELRNMSFKRHLSQLVIVILKHVLHNYKHFWKINMFKTLKTHSLKITLIIIINNTQLPFSYENIIIWLNTRRRFLQAEVLKKGSEKFICPTHPKRRRLEHTHSRGVGIVSPTLYSPFLDDSFSFFFI